MFFLFLYKNIGWNASLRNWNGKIRCHPPYRCPSPASSATNRAMVRTPSTLAGRPTIRSRRRPGTADASVLRIRICRRATRSNRERFSRHCSRWYPSSILLPANIKSWEKIRKLHARLRFSARARPQGGFSPTELTSDVEMERETSVNGDGMNVLYEWDGMNVLYVL